MLVVALAARVIAFLDLRSSLYFTSLLPDEGVYDAWAKAIVAGSARGQTSDFPELPAQLFAVVYRLFGAEPGYARGLNVVVGVAAVGVIYACGAAIGGRRVAIVAGGLAAVSRGLVFHSVTLHTTALSILLAAGVLLTVLHAVTHPENDLMRRSGQAGALLGLAVNVRPNLALLLPVAGVLIWIAARQAGIARRTRVLASAGLLAAYVGCAAASGSVSGPAFGFNLYIGNDPANPEPYFRPTPFAASDPSRQSVAFTLEASRREGRALTTREASGYFARAVADAAKRAPGAFARKLAQKALLVLHHELPANNHNFAFLSGQLASLRAPWLADWIALVLGVVGLVFGSQRRACVAGRWLAGAYAFSLVLFFVEERLRAPLLALLLPFAALALVDAYQQFRWPHALLALALCVASWWPMAGADGLSTAYNLHALLLYDAGRLDEAERFYTRSAQLGEQDSPGAYLGLAAIYEKRGDWQRALLTLIKLPDRDYKAASKYEAAGNIAVEQHMLHEASIAYEKSLALDGSNLRVYRPLAVVYRLLGQKARAEDAEKRERFASSFHGQ